ncbi:MAG TPA: hypothetical protein VG015_01930 [Candidatus Dormibacteraeota bacterium]|nr:hypothetical protein [Candidatus Dormibacteraeota bacterium]
MSQEPVVDPIFETKSDPRIVALVNRLESEDVLGQLLERRGTAAQLATEGGDIKLGWLDQLAWVVEHPNSIATVEASVAAIRDRGIRHLIWAGMGGSVACVRVLEQMGILSGTLRVHTLESTDPRSLNAALDKISEGTSNLKEALAATAMVGVAMGMTSEEPITHLQWFADLLHEYEVPSPADHMLVLTLEGSYLDKFAIRHGVERRAVQPDGESHTPGRMSAPSTHVFLYPAAIALAPEYRLGEVVFRCQDSYRLHPGLDREARNHVLREDPFVSMSAWLAGQMVDGRNKVVLQLAPELAPIGPWIEQGIEESLGKGGEGLLIFLDQDLEAAQGWNPDFVVLTIGAGEDAGVAALRAAGHPTAHLRVSLGDDVVGRLATVARMFAGWDLSVALIGYLSGIVFAGQPAVEGYKKYARDLRDAEGDLPYPTACASDPTGVLQLDYLDLGESLGSESMARQASELGVNLDHDPAGVLAIAAKIGLESERLSYLDVTLNATPDGPLWDLIAEAGTHFANHVLRRPVKIRTGPRDYHSTEQSEVDGPPGVLSLRFLLNELEPIQAGRYTPRFLHAQALGTALAMKDAGRPVLLAMLPNIRALEPVKELFSRAEALLQGTAIPSH